MKNEKVDFENKIVGAYMRAEERKDIDWHLRLLDKFKTENGIEKIDTYYVENELERAEYQRLITDIFEENIDILLAVGGAEELRAYPELLEKIKKNVKVINVDWD